MPSITCEQYRPRYYERIRFTRLDNCGRRIYGPDSTWVIDMPVSVQVTRNMQEGETNEITLPDGRVCDSSSTPARLLNHTVTITLCSIDPALMVALNGSNTPVFDYLFRTVGWDETQRQSDVAVAMEGWLTLSSSSSSACQPDNGELVGEGRWGYIGFYYLKDFTETGDITYGGSDSQYMPTIVATADPRASWGVGPYNVQLNPGSPPTPGPFITPVPSDNARRSMVIDVEPPEITCGPRPLSNPAAPLILITQGDNDMELCVQTLADDGEWVVDFGDGAPTQIFTPDEQVCYQYTEEGCYNIGVWASNNQQLYRGEHWCLPQQMTLDIVPSSGEVPLDVVATVGNAPGGVQPVMDWGDR